MGAGYSHLVHAQEPAASFRIADCFVPVAHRHSNFFGFAFGLVRDLWNPFGWLDPGYFRIFVPLTMNFLVGVAFSRTTYTGLLFGMLLTTISYSFLAAAFSGIVGSYRPGSADAGKPEHLVQRFYE
jgi:hypothetical protein